MSREGSGTSWLPDDAPIYADMQMFGGDMLMLHGVAFPRYTRVGGDRDVSADGDGGRAKFDAPSMVMAMYSHPLGDRDEVGVRVMGSLDPLIEQDYGYPLLYQSGETYHGEPLHDRQHPHDFIAELAGTYTHRLSIGALHLYAGYPGEPALGPPMFLHRPSGMDNPDAPISHHWQDATHISFGVVTAGFSAGDFKIEASVFNGREPDEKRYAFDHGPLDSYSGRLSWNPTSQLALQISHGYLRHPEAHEPDVDVHRTTASAIYERPLGPDSHWSTTFVWGQNRAHGEASNAYLLESSYQRGAGTVFGRAEHVQKSGAELVLPPPREEELFDVGVLALGYVHDVVHGHGLDVGLGAQVTLDHNEAALADAYGGRTHLGYQMFLRLRPSKMSMRM